VSADSIVPGAGKPQALNRFAYTFNNPLKYTDPSGHCPRHDDECEELQQQTQEKYNILMTGHWNTSDINLLQQALELVAGRMGGDAVFISVWRKTEFRRAHEANTPESRQSLCGNANAVACAPGNTIRLLDHLFARTAWYFNNAIAHELAHVWDTRTIGWNPYTQRVDNEGLSSEMGSSTGSFPSSCYSPKCDVNTYWGLRPGGANPVDSYARTDKREDWARAFEIWATGDNALTVQTYDLIQWSSRQAFVQEKVDAVRQRINPLR
jgi:hypothetical protein